MLDSVQAATEAIAEFLSTMEVFTDEVVNNCDELLLTIWDVQNRFVRAQIIQVAAIKVGLVSEEAEW